MGPLQRAGISNSFERRDDGRPLLASVCAHTLAIEELRDRIDHGLAIKQLVVIVIRAWY